MQYLIISSEFPPGPGGIGKHAYSLAKALVHHGVDVAVVCNMDYTDDERRSLFMNELPQGIRVLHIKRNGFATYTNRIKAVLKLCRHQQFDKVVVSGQFSIWMGMFIKALYPKLNVAAFIHGSELLLGGTVKKWLTLYSLKKMDILYPVSDYTSQLLSDRLRLKSKIIPNGLNVDDWKRNAEPLPWLGSPKLLTVGSITKRKGQHNVIKALPLLIKHYPGIHYHIVGLPTNAESLLQLATVLNVSDHITIHGAVTDEKLKQGYISADVFCMLSEENNGDVEGFGIAVLEANINGIPAIGSKNTGIEDAIKKGETGYLVNANHPDEILSAVQRILDSDMQAACINWAQQHNWNDIVKQIL